MNAKERNLLIVKYAFLLLVGAYILSSIWVIWRVKVLVDYAEETMPDDWATGVKGEGHYAKYWFIACIVVTILGGLLSGGAFYGVYQESSQIVMVYSALMFVIAVYGAWDKYMKVTVTGKWKVFFVWATFFYRFPFPLFSFPPAPAHRHRRHPLRQSQSHAHL